MQSLRELRSVLPLLALLAFISFVAAGCGGGGGGSSDTPTKNLSTTSIKVIDAEGTPVNNAILEIGHPFIIELGIYAAEATGNVSVDFYIIDRKSYDTPPVAIGDDVAVEMTHYHVGSVFLGSLTTGDNISTTEIVIPYTTEDLDDEGNVVYSGVLLAPGVEYYLFAELDPADLIAEFDEQDNRPSAENLGQTMVVVSVDDSYKDTPNLVLEKILLEVPAFEVTNSIQEAEEDSCGNEIVPKPDENNIEKSHIRVTAVINATGRYWPTYPSGTSVPIPRVKFQATIKTPGLVGIGDIPVLLWDSLTQQYSSTLSIQDVEPGTPISVSLELRLPGPEVGAPMLNLLVSELTAKASACVSDCNLDRDCFANEIISGDSCDSADLTACGGSVSGIPPNISIKDPDWSCYVERIDGICLAQCNPDLDCITSCAQELVDLDIRVTAFDEYGKEITEFQPGLTPDNELQTELIILPAPDPGPPAPTDPVQFETGFDKSFSAKLVYAGLSAYAWAGLDGGGASTGLEAALPVVLFRGSPSACDPSTEDCLLGYETGEVFLGVRSSLSAMPVLMPGSSSISSVDIYAFGQNLFPKVLDFTCSTMSVEELSQWNLGGLDCARTCASDYPSLEKTDPGYAAREVERADCLRGCWAFGKSTLLEKDFVVGVVPLTASFEAWGLIGAEVSLDLPDACAEDDFVFEAHTGPWADLGTEVSAGVGSSNAFSAGVGGELNPLLGDTFFATVKVVDLSYDLNSNITGTLHEDITNTLTGPQGNVFFYVGYPCIKICRKWGVPYPCGWKQCKAKQPIVGFKTFEIEDVLFCAEQDFSGPAQ